MLPRLKVTIFTVLIVFVSSLVVRANLPVINLVHDDDHAKYQVTLTTDSAAPQTDQAFTLTLDIATIDGAVSVTEFDEVHTKLLHLIVVSEDLTQFLHLHPAYQGEGRFVLEGVILPEAGNYILYSDFTPTGESQQVVRSTLSTSGATMNMPHLTPGTDEVAVGPLTVRLDLPNAVSAGVTMNINFHVSDSKSGKSIDSLDEYLGAAGHLVIIDESTAHYIHTHPAGDHDMSAMGGMKMQYGPDISFEAEFPEVGLWAAWLQVQYKGDIYTVPFVIPITDASAPQPEASREAHSHG